MISNEKLGLGERIPG